VPITAIIPGHRAGFGLAGPTEPVSQAKSGIATRSPPRIADSWAQIPTAVQLAAVTASIAAGRSSTMLRTNSWTRCGCDPPWPLPWMNDRCWLSSS
jgi:hypothetical protein